MSSKEQYKEYNKKLNRQVKELKKEIDIIRCHNWDLRARLSSFTKSTTIYRTPIKVKIIWFIYGVALGGLINLIINK